MHTRLGQLSLEEHFRCSVRDRLSLAIQRFHDNPQVTDFGGELTAYQQEVRIFKSALWDKPSVCSPSPDV